MVCALAPARPTRGTPTDFPGIIEIPEEKEMAYTELYLQKADMLKKLMETGFFKQRTEQAGALLSFIQGHKDRNFRIVLLSQVLRIVADRNSSSKGDLLKELLTLKLLSSLLGEDESFVPMEDKCLTCEKKTGCPIRPIVPYLQAT